METAAPSLTARRTSLVPERWSIEGPTSHLPEMVRLGDRLVSRLNGKTYELSEDGEQMRATPVTDGSLPGSLLGRELRRGDEIRLCDGESAIVEAVDPQGLDRYLMIRGWDIRVVVSGGEAVPVVARHGQR